MATYKNYAIINYPVNEVFNIFKITAKRDFPRFNENNPIGNKVQRKVGAYSVKSGEMTIEITDYKKDEVYEITSSQGANTYKSRYEFLPLEGEKTKLVLVETQNSWGIFNIINVIVASIFFKGRIKKRFSFLIQGLNNQIQEKKNCIEKAQS